MKHDSLGEDVHDPLDQLAAGVARVVGEHHVSDLRGPLRADDQEPVTGLKGGRHRTAAHLDHVDPAPHDDRNADEDEEQQDAAPLRHRFRKVVR